MKINKLYEILGIKPYVPPEQPKTIFIVSNEANVLFKTAKNSIEQNHQREYSVSFTHQMVTKYENGKTKSYTHFINAANPEMLRGRTIDTLIIDETISKQDVDYIKMCLGPAAREIIVLDKQE
jgi:hypothetical protein